MSSAESTPRLRRSRRSSNNPRIDAQGSPTSSPSELKAFSPGDRTEEIQARVFDNRVPPSHDTTIDSDDLDPSKTHTEESSIHSSGQSESNQKKRKTSFKKKKGKSHVKRSVDCKKEESKRKSEESKFDRRGPIVKCLGREGPELETILNAPDREEEDIEKNKRVSNPFYVDLEAQAKSAKIGFNSTLHNNYDAFNKDLSWFCAFCKNYSHYRTLGDLFGPFFIKGLKLVKKTYPEVVEGQVVEIALSPTPSYMDGGVASLSSRHKSRRTPKHDASFSSDVSLEAKRLEIGSCSPPSRFVPSATPARMLGRGGCTPNSPRVPLHSPLRGVPPSSSQLGGTNNAPPTSSSSSSATNLAISSSEATTTSSAEVSLPAGTECWVHDACALWASGITVVNSKLCGLEEAVIAAQESFCYHCGETGATVCCLGRGCNLIAHIPCARLFLWSLDLRTFRSFCPKHIPPTPSPSSPNKLFFK
ncbi:Transcription factor 20 [Armadillidium nasatum]|uniref:Transcription factor 20 n=1 Tax=Armadillidium nasatum TaxID=96803 RepID=A0A5N5SSK7_9CRUS|nr:Transcription factor 20 [Armadillidium nasatum]